MNAEKLASQTAGGRPKPYACEDCDKRYSNKDDLKVHVVGTHTGEKWDCPVCKAKIIATDKLIKRHEEVCAAKKAGTVPEGFKKCPHCDHRCRSDNLGRHVRKCKGASKSPVEVPVALPSLEPHTRRTLAVEQPEETSVVGPSWNQARTQVAPDIDPALIDPRLDLDPRQLEGMLGQYLNRDPTEED